VPNKKNNLKSYLIYSQTEIARQDNVARLQKQMPNLQLVEAIYPSKQKVPFLQAATDISKERTGYALLPGEIGCLLSHRLVWRQIVQSATNNKEHFLILESDSNIKDLEMLTHFDCQVLEQYDLFFWGAWDGHMQLFKSSIKKLMGAYQLGTPFIKTIYCTYGYSLNKTMAKMLLARTRKFNYPVDQYKRFMQQADCSIGAVVPELISTTGAQSNIRGKRKWEIVNQLYLMVLDLKNYLICLFK
jgi:GR25 family glycosyltransferase involved in LPS biosynthesis